MSEQERESSAGTAPELIWRFWRQLKRLWALVLAVTLVTALVTGIRDYRSYSPMYEAKARLAVSSSYNGTDIFSSSYYDSATAQQLAEAFPHLLGTDLMKDLMLERLDKPYINGTITPKSVGNTNMFVLTVRSNDPQDACDVLEAAIACYPLVAVYMVDNPRIDVLEEPKVPTTPVNTFSWKESMTDGAVTGLVIGLALVALAAALTKTVTSAHQLQRIANVPVLATFPQLLTKKRRSQKETVLDPLADTGFAEALRGLGLKLRKQLEDQSSRVIVVTSTISGEGKTTTAVSLAKTLSEGGSRVVLVDADLRNQSVARLCGEKGGSGLMAYLKDPNRSVLKGLRKMPDCDVQYLSGESSGDWRYIIDTKQMQRVLKELQSAFDYVVVDTSPCAVVAETALLCRFGQSVVYVVRSDWAREAQVFDNVSSLYEREVPITGFVYNGASRNRGGYGYGYRYGYGYGYGRPYGYGYGYGSKKK